MSRRERVVLQIAKVLGVKVCLGDPEEAHDHLRRVDPLLAAELATEVQVKPPEGRCAMCGGKLSTGGCSAKMEFHQDGGYWSGTNPRLVLHAYCRGLKDEAEAVERLWYWLRVKVPASRKEGEAT